MVSISSTVNVVLSFRKFDFLFWSVAIHHETLIWAGIIWENLQNLLRRVYFHARHLIPSEQTGNYHFFINEALRITSF